MKLITQDILKKTPRLYGQEKEEDKTFYFKLFCPWGSATWYIAEYDPEERVGFGYCTGLYDDEWGYVSIDELEDLKGPFGLKVERDRVFDPIKFSELRLAGKV